MELILWSGGGVGVGQAVFDQSAEIRGGDGFVGGLGEEEAGAPRLADGVGEKGGTASGERALGEGVEGDVGGESFVFGKEEDDDRDIGFFGVVTEEAAEVFGLGLGQFEEGVDQRVVAGPGLGGGEEFRCDVLEMHRRGRATVFAELGCGGGLGWEAVGKEKGDPGAEVFRAFGKNERGGVSVFGAEGGAEGRGIGGAILAQAREETAERCGSGFTGDLLPFFLIPSGQGQVSFGETGGWWIAGDDERGAQRPDGGDDAMEARGSA